MRDQDPAWRNRDLPPSPLHTHEYKKITSWLDRGGDINDTRMDKNKANINLRVMVDDSDYTECDGMTPLEIVEYKMEFARDPLRERYADLRTQILNAAEGRPILLTSPVWTGLVGSSAPPAKTMSTEAFDDGRGM